MTGFNIVLLEPEIPANTGNIGRTCVACGARLHLIEPLGFFLSESRLRRAGMDYWDRLDVTRYRNFEDFLARNPAVCAGTDFRGDIDLFMATTKAERTYDQVHYRPGGYIMFGRESAGIPEELLMRNRKNCVRIPMLHEARSLNLSNAAAIVLYEALRQNGFAGLESAGQLHRHRWGEPVREEQSGTLPGKDGKQK